MTGSPTRPRAGAGWNHLFSLFRLTCSLSSNWNSDLPCPSTTEEGQKGKEVSDQKGDFSSKFKITRTYESHEEGGQGPFLSALGEQVWGPWEGMCPLQLFLHQYTEVLGLPPNSDHQGSTESKLCAFISGPRCQPQVSLKEAGSWQTFARWYQCSGQARKTCQLVKRSEADPGSRLDPQLAHVT